MYMLELMEIVISLNKIITSQLSYFNNKVPSSHKVYFIKDLFK